MSKLRGYFITGFIAIIPIATTIGITLIIIKGINSLLKMPISSMLGIKKGVLTGLIDLTSGIVITSLFVVLVGYATARLGKRGIFRWIESLMERLPVINSLYISIKELVKFVAFNKTIEGFNKVVLVEYPRKGLYAIGFVTAKSINQIDELTKNRLLNIYLPKPMSLASGFLILVPEDEVIPLDITVEEAFKTVVSGGLITPK